MCTDIEKFVGLPFKSQLHQCCLMYCLANGISAYKNKKPSPDYFKCRAYLFKLPTQDIKNIALMLMKERKPVYLYDLLKKAQEYVEQERTGENKKRIEELSIKQDYDMDAALIGFLRWKVTRKLLICLSIMVASCSALYVWDDYYSDRALDRFETGQREYFKKHKTPNFNSDAGEIFYFLAWRILENTLPSVSEFLAPTPAMSSVEHSDRVMAQEYYYDSWHGITIRICESEEGNK